MFSTILSGSSRGFELQRSKVNQAYLPARSGLVSEKGMAAVVVSMTSSMSVGWRVFRSSSSPMADHRARRASFQKSTVRRGISRKAVPYQHVCLEDLLDALVPQTAGPQAALSEHEAYRKVAPALKFMSREETRQCSMTTFTAVRSSEDSQRDVEPPPAMHESAHNLRTS